MWYVGDNFASPHSQMRQQMKSRSCLGYIRFLLGWSEDFANGAWVESSALCKTKACRRTLHVIAVSAGLFYLCLTKPAQTISQQMTKLLRKKMLRYLFSWSCCCHSRFPGCPQTASLPVGHVTGGDLLAGHIPWRLLLLAILHPGVQGPQRALPHQVAVLQTHL